MGRFSRDNYTNRKNRGGTEDLKEEHSKTKHILVVSQYFYPEPFRINDMCQEWIKRGYKVTVLTGIPNYPTGTFYKGYSWFKKRRETWNGISIIRIPIIARGSNSLCLILNYLSFVFSGFIWKIFTRLKADYVFTFEVSPMTQALIGCWYAKKKHIPHYLYVQDLWPDNVVSITGISNPIIIRPIDKMVDYIYKNSTEVFATSPSFVEAICNRDSRVDVKKVHYWPQYAESFYERVDDLFEELGESSCFRVVFTGNIGRAQGLQLLPKTAVLLKEEKVQFVVVGDGRYLNELVAEIREKDVEDKFIILPRQPAEQIPCILSSCDVAFLSFQNNILWEKTIPAKLQSYMACGMPIIAAAKGETERIIREALCGRCCAIDDANALAESIKVMMNDELEEMGKNSRRYYDKYFEKQKLMDEMDCFFN